MFFQFVYFGENIFFLGNIQVGFLLNPRVQAGNLFVYGAQVLGYAVFNFLGALAQFIISRADRSSLWFGLMCLVIACRLVILGRYIADEMPTFSTATSMRLEYLTGYLAVPLVGLFVREASHDDEAGVVRLYVDHGETAVVHLLRNLDAAGFAPTSIALNKPSLDDVFLRQTGRSLREEAA